MTTFKLFFLSAAIFLGSFSPAHAYFIYNRTGAAVAIGGGGRICPVWGCGYNPIGHAPPVGVCLDPSCGSAPTRPAHPMPPIPICPAWGCGPTPVVGGGHDFLTN